MSVDPGRPLWPSDPTVLAERVERLRKRVADEGLDSYLLFGLENIRYITGFSGSSGAVLLTPEETILISDFRYRLRIQEEAPLARYVEVNDQLKDHLADILEGIDGLLGVEDAHLSIEQWHRLEQGLNGRGHRLAGGLVEDLRMVKSPAEVAALRESCALVSRVIASLTEREVVGRAERELALDLEVFARREGSEKVPFDYIVASGPRGAMPHAEASQEVIEPGGLLVVDIGTSVLGYASDMTRTFATGELSGQEREIYEIVLRAQEAARQAAKPGVRCADLDKLGRGIIEEAGYGQGFQHSLGHGVGLEVHERPRVSAASEDVLQEGMVVTIEPGIYVPGLGGVRIEDTVLVTPEGVESLTDYQRSLVTLS